MLRRTVAAVVSCGHRPAARAHQDVQGRAVAFASLRSLAMASRLIADRTWVARRLAAGATVTAIAKEAEVSRQTAYTWLARHGLRAEPNARRRPSPSRLRTLYERHGTVAAVARLTDVAPGTAHRWLIHAGVMLAGPGARWRLGTNRELTELRDKRNAGATLAELAAEYQVSKETIRRRLHEPTLNGPSSQDP